MKNKEIVLQHHQKLLQADELSRGLYSCSMLGRKIIAFASVNIQETLEPLFSNQNMYINVHKSEFKISEILKQFGMKKSGDNYLIIKNAIQELRNAGVEIVNNDEEYHAYNWFSCVHYNKTKDKIELTFTEEIGKTLLALKTRYKALNLKTIGEFKSFYAFRFYEIALSWSGFKGKNGNQKGCWFFQMTVDEIRQTFKIDENAYQGRMDNFVRKVLVMPLKELNEVNSEFEIELSKVMRGRNLIGFRFDCKEKEKESKKIAISKNDFYELKKTKIKLNEEEELIYSLKKEHADEWQDFFEFEMKQQMLFVDDETKKLLAEKTADNLLLKKYKK